MTTKGEAISALQRLRACYSRLAELNKASDEDALWAMLTASDLAWFGVSNRVDAELKITRILSSSGGFGAGLIRCPGYGLSPDRSGGGSAQRSWVDASCEIVID